MYVRVPGKLSSATYLFEIYSICGSIFLAMNMSAYLGECIGPILVPSSWEYVLSEKLNKLFFRTNFSMLTINLVGIFCDFLSLRASSVHCVPSSWGILVNRYFTSNDARRVLLGSFYFLCMSSICLIQSGLS